MVGPSLFSRLASTLLHPLAPQDVLSLLDPVHSSRQLRGVVTSVTRETPGTATIAFRPGPGWRAHDAGQWARIGVDVDGVRQWRSYSLSAPAGADPEITVSDIGLVSGTLVRHTKPGDVLFLDIPEGDFTLPDEPRPLLMLTAGSGLTPVMSMIRTLVPTRRDADVVLIHSSRTPEDALFREELAELADQFPGLRVVHHHTAETGRLDLSSPAQLEGLCPDWRDRAAYACGPAEFLDDAEDLWRREAGEDLRIERFRADFAAGVAGAGGRVVFEHADAEADAPGDVPLLIVAEEAGVAAPSGCRMGICHACLTPLRSGQVTDLRSGEVHGEPGELIQTCVSAAAGPLSLDL
ncbi:ferredoxin reductase [Micrococcus luteus]|uniref:ferredoxin reductase n=1 Tax=Micrococcus sp. KRD070 TaxID=2729719 RepID=UPI0019D0301E|nr:ferredoxin reductase [Micrococcus sp. KRD070]MCV7471065.1 ferredoxin reductase [Micrococcus luteus]MCV7486151.1 ferredoxin reductase [Micrococcus luteus]MCV7598370.1 ferredoxin reductase [Micrococcus luteus]